MTTRATRIYLALALVLVGGINAAHAANYNLEANFDGLQMVPPNASPAFGLMTGTLDDFTGNFSVTAGSYQDLLGGSNQILLNSGAAGANGAFIMALVNDTPGAATGTFSGGGVLTAPQIADMIAGNTYLRVTGSVFPGGEIRGQVTVVPEPSALALAGLGIVGVLAAAWRRRRKS